MQSYPTVPVAYRRVHLPGETSFIGPPVEASTLASLRDTFDLSAFASLNPLGLAVSLLLMVMLIAAAVMLGAPQLGVFA